VGGLAGPVLLVLAGVPLPFAGSLVAAVLGTPRSLRSGFAMIGTALAVRVF
jgi:hypothetical protein